jgi:hypothetical protein
MHTGDKGQGASCASVAGGSRVVAQCDRCAVEAALDEQVKVHWSVLLMSWPDGVRSTQRMLCRDCTRTFRLFMLGSSIEPLADWNKVIESARSGAV